MNKKKPDKELEQAALGMEPQEGRDEALFDALGKSRKKKKRRIVRTVTAIVVLVAIVVFAAVSILQRRVREQFASGAADVLAYKASVGTISTVVSGSGTLVNVDTETVTIPEGVEIDEILVSRGDAVKEGDLLATVDQATVGTAMSSLQTRIEDLDEQIRDAEGDKVSTYIRAGVPGRVKIICAEKDMSVADCMVEYGALAVISLDGYMALDVKTDLLRTGDSVTVIRAEGNEITGTVESVSGGKATILVTDNGPQNDEAVTVRTGDGAEVGTAKLYIHNPLSVTGYAGTVRKVNVTENQKVHSGTAIFTLTDTGSTANYDMLLRERSDAEETLLELLRVQRNGGITAPISGSVYSVATGDEETLLEVAVISPDVSMSVTITVDESDILSLELGQNADIEISSVSEDTFVGTVTEIDRTASGGYYTAVITLDKAEGMLSGMTAEVDVRIEGVENAVLIPVEALHQTSRGAYVYTAYDEENEEYGGKVDVVTGLSNSNYVEIKSGLRAGDTVYYTEKLSIADMFANMGGMNGYGGGNRGGQSGGKTNSGNRMPDGEGERPAMPGGNRD